MLRGTGPFFHLVGDTAAVREAFAIGNADDAGQAHMLSAALLAIFGSASAAKVRSITQFNITFTFDADVEVIVESLE